LQLFLRRLCVFHRRLDFALDTLSSITTMEAFAYGMAGALFTYLVIFRAERLRFVHNDFRRNWRMLVFDILVCALGGGFAAAYVMTAQTIKEAVLTGMTWNSLIAGLIQSEVKYYVEQRLIKPANPSEIDKQNPDGKNEI